MESKIISMGIITLMATALGCIIVVIIALSIRLFAWLLNMFVNFLVKGGEFIRNYYKNIK